MKYTSDGKYYVWDGENIIAISLYGSKIPGVKHDVRILQGMPRTETIEKICEDCPDFAKSCGITKDYYPYLVSEQFLKKEAKKAKRTIKLLSDE